MNWSWIDVKRVGWMLFVLLVLLVTLKAAWAEPVNLTPGQLYNFSYTNASDELAWQEFFCQNTTNVTACAANYTVMLTLEPGSSKNATNGTCAASASCSPSNDTSGLCTISRTLYAGDTFDRESDACDVHFTCSAETRNESVQTVLFSKTLRLASDGEKMWYEYDGRKSMEFATNDSFDFEKTIDFACPVSVNASALDSVDLLSFCKESMPYMSTWVDLTLKSLIDKGDRLETCVGQKNGLESDYVAQKAEVDQELLTCNVQLNSTIDLWDRCKEQVANEQGNNGWYLAFIIVLSMVAGFLLVLSVVLGFSLMRERTIKGGAP